MKGKHKNKTFLKSIALTWHTLRMLAGKSAWMVLIQSLILALIICYGTIFQPYILIQIYGALETGNLKSLYWVCLFGGGIILLFFGLSYLNNVYLDLNSFKVKLLASKNACQLLYKLPFDEINTKFKEADILNRIDTASLNMVSVIVSIGLIVSNTASIFMLVGMFSNYPLIFIIVTLLIACWGFFSSRLVIGRRRKYEITLQALEDDAGGIAYEAIHEISFTSMYGCAQHIYTQYETIRRQIWNARWKQESVSVLVSALTSLFSSTLRGSLGFVLFPLYKNGQMATNNIASSFSIYDKLSASVNQYSAPFVDIGTRTVSVQRLNEVLTIESIDPLSTPPEDDDLLIKAENIAYIIEDRYILNGITLSVRKGEKIALIGQNGCGKSTLLRIIAGLYHPNSGTLTIKKISPNHCQDITYIPSSPFLYSESVQTNIAMNGDGDLTQSLKAAQLDCKQEDLLDKVATSLSGGQSQRVNIARGLIHKTPLLLADEPTSGLSISQGEEVMQNILSAANTAIIVTHHPAQLRYFTRIILMTAGKIVSSGSLEHVSAHLEYKRWIGEISEKTADEL